MNIIVIGAGLSGLMAAHELHRNGVSVRVFEASSDIGGRVRSDRIGGFVFDRGFQVLFTAYPWAKRTLNYAALYLKPFEAGAVICRGDRRHVLSNPFDDPASVLQTMTTPIIPFADKLRTAKLGLRLASMDDIAIRTMPDMTTESFLRENGFSESYLDNFLRPFFGGIFLRRDLSTTCRAFGLYWKMLATGQTVVPANGMGCIAQQMATELDSTNRIHRNTVVASLIRDANGAACGVVLANGEMVGADAVIVATDSSNATRFGIKSAPTEPLGSTTVYFASKTALWDDRKIRLNANRNAFVNSATLLTNVVPNYAPSGHHFLSVTVLGVPNLDDVALETAIRHDLTRMFAGDRATLTALTTYERLAIYRIPFAQFAQPVGIYDRLPAIRNDNGVIYTGEYTVASSINGAIESGIRAAELLLNRD